MFVVLKDPDLNQKHDKIETYHTVNDPNSPNVDTVGTVGGDILLEILIKDIRYKRCTINAVEHGGLASTGFTLTETSPNSGVFEGSFKLPTQICNKTGTKLISTAGGSLDAKYHDFRDSLGNPNIFSAISFDSSSSGNIIPSLNAKKFILPEYKQTTDVILTGKINDYKQGTKINISLVGPDKSTEDFGVFGTQKGEYKVVMTLNHNSLPGHYDISIDYLNNHIGSVSFQVSKHLVPDWIKNNAGWWADEKISDSEFVNGIEHLIDQNIIIIPDSTTLKNSQQNIPIWIKNTAEWWSLELVSDDEFVAALEFLVNNGIIRI